MESWREYQKRIERWYKKILEPAMLVLIKLLIFLPATAYVIYMSQGGA